MASTPVNNVAWWHVSAKKDGYPGDNNGGRHRSSVRGNRIDLTRTCSVASIVELGKRRLCDGCGRTRVRLVRPPGTTTSDHAIDKKAYLFGATAAATVARLETSERDRMVLCMQERGESIGVLERWEMRT